MKKMQVLSVCLLGSMPGVVLATPFTYTYSFGTVAEQNAWTVTINNDANGPGIPEYGVPDAGSVRIKPKNAGTKDTGDIRLYKQVQAPTGFVFSNLVLSGIGMGYSSHVTWADLLLSPDGNWGTTNTNPLVVRGRASGGYDEVPIVADASSIPEYQSLSSVFLQIRIVDALAVGNPATNSPYARSISLSGELTAGGTISTGSEWNVDGSGDWNNLLNWQNGVPNGVDAIAKFLVPISSPQTVYTNMAVTVGTMRFDNLNTYVIGGAGSLTLQTSTGNGSIEVVSGGHQINLPLFFASNTDIGIADGATLTISNPMTIQASKTVTKTGTVVIEGPLTIEANGGLVLTSGATRIFSAPTLAAGAKIDVKNNSMTVDYRGQTSPATTIKNQLAGGYAAGTWNGAGINTSSAIANQTALGWKDDAANQSILVKYTYYGDANLDGQVDISDLGALATAWQTSAVWSQGDFDYSGFVDISDLGKLATNWQLGVGNPLGPSFDEALASVGLAGVRVPEPGSLLVMMGGLLLLHRRSRNA